MIPKILKPILRPLRPVYYRHWYKPKPTPETETSELYPRYMNSNDVVVEIGARVGGGTLLLSKLVNQVYSFEPNSDSFRQLKRNSKKNDNVTLFNFALGAEDGEALLYVSKYMKYSHIATLKKRGNVEYEAKEKVKIRRLDDFKFPKKPSALIIDCEGFEEEVLKGATETLNTVQKVLIETHKFSDGTSSETQVIPLLSNFNTKLVDGWVIAISD